MWLCKKESLDTTKITLSRRFFNRFLFFSLFLPLFFVIFSIFGSSFASASQPTLPSISTTASIPSNVSATQYGLNSSKTGTSYNNCGFSNSPGVANWQCLPAWRWSENITLYSNVCSTCVIQSAFNGLAGILFSASSTIWGILLTVIKFAAGFAIPTSINKLLEYMFVYIADPFSLFGSVLNSNNTSSLAYLVIALAIPFAIIRYGRGGGHKSFIRCLLRSILPFVAIGYIASTSYSDLQANDQNAQAITLCNGQVANNSQTNSAATTTNTHPITQNNQKCSNALSTNVQLGTTVGSAAWLVNTGSNIDNVLADTVASSMQGFLNFLSNSSQFGLVGSSSNATPNCTDYTNTMTTYALNTAQFVQGGVHLNQTNISEAYITNFLWQTGFLNQFIEAQYGLASSAGFRIYCHYLDNLANISPQGQGTIATSAGYPGNPSLWIYGPFTSEGSADTLNTGGSNNGDASTSALTQDTFAWAFCSSPTTYSSDPNGQSDTWNATAGTKWLQTNGGSNGMYKNVLQGGLAVAEAHAGGNSNSDGGDCYEWYHMGAGIDYQHFQCPQNLTQLPNSLITYNNSNNTSGNYLYNSQPKCIGNSGATNPFALTTSDKINGAVVAGIANSYDGTDSNGNHIPLTQNEINDLNSIQSFMNSWNGNNAGSRLVEGFLSLITAGAFLWSFAPMALGSAAMLLGLVLVLLLPFILASVALPIDSASKLTGLLSRGAIAAVTSKTIFGLLLTMQIALSAFLESLIVQWAQGNNGIGGVFLSIFYAAAPLAALWILRKLLKMAGFGDIMSLKGASKATGQMASKVINNTPQARAAAQKAASQQAATGKPPGKGGALRPSISPTGKGGPGAVAGRKGLFAGLKQQGGKLKRTLLDGTPFAPEAVGKAAGKAAKGSALMIGGGAKKGVLALTNPDVSEKDKLKRRLHDQLNNAQTHEEKELARKEYRDGVKTLKKQGEIGVVNKARDALKDTYIGEQFPKHLAELKTKKQQAQVGWQQAQNRWKGSLDRRAFIKGNTLPTQVNGAPLAGGIALGPVPSEDLKNLQKAKSQLPSHVFSVSSDSTPNSRASTTSASATVNTFADHHIDPKSRLNDVNIQSRRAVNAVQQNSDIPKDITSAFQISTIPSGVFVVETRAGGSKLISEEIAKGMERAQEKISSHNVPSLPSPQVERVIEKETIREVAAPRAERVERVVREERVTRGNSSSSNRDELASIATAAATAAVEASARRDRNTPIEINLRENKTARESNIDVFRDNMRVIAQAIQHQGIQHRDDVLVLRNLIHNQMGSKYEKDLQTKLNRIENGMEQNKKVDSYIVDLIGSINYFVENA